MYARLPSQQELDAMGFTLEDYETDPVEIWPENQESISLFSRVSTQWRVGMNGPTGLDYMPLFHQMDRMGLTPDRYDQMLDDIRVIEAEALTLMNKKD